MNYFLVLTNIILTVTKSADANKRINVAAFKKFGIELVIHLKKAFLNKRITLVL